MQNIVLYLSTVLIWGTTWFAIKMQVGVAPDELAIVYRGIIGATGLVLWCKIKKLSLRFNALDHIYLFLLGLSMFSLHYLFIYNASHYMVSGVVAVIFSSVGFCSILNNWIFFNVRPSLYTIFGALVGISGLSLFFWHELSNISTQEQVIEGIALSSIGVLIFSLGGTISKRNTNMGLPIIPSAAIASIYGAIVMIIYTLFIKKIEFILPNNIAYWGAVIYLAVFASIISFICYFKIVQNIGPELAGYTTVVAPLIALVISSVKEGYIWSIADIFGLIFVVLGNILVLAKKRKFD